MSHVATVDPLWKCRAHALPVPDGARKGRLSVGQWAHNSLLTWWSLSCSSLNRYWCLSSHSSPWWWRRGSSMGVQSAVTTMASRNRIGACTRGPASWVDLAVRVDRRRNLFIPRLVGAACLISTKNGCLEVVIWVLEREKSSAAISLKLKWWFSVTISFTLAMLTSVEDVDGWPERGKSSTTSRSLLNALYDSYARVFHKVDSP